ncbi:PKD domain-containing protein [Lacinutrix undariae]
MKHKYPLPLFFACFLLISTIALTAPIFSVNTFLTPSATIAGSTTICQNSAMPIVTFTGSGGSAPYTFEYTINNGSTLTISTTDSDNSVSIPVNTGTSGTFTYTLVGVSDSVDIDIETQSGSAVIAVQPTPDTSMGGTGSGSVYEGVSVFRVCMNTSSLFNFTNTSSTQGGLNTNYTIDWGDGSPNFSGNSWSVLSHTYDVGLWNVMYTVEGNNGCSSTQNYIVFVGSNPAVSLGNPGNTDVCNTSSLTFPITGTENNPPGTTYTVTFNDGSESEVFNHPPPASVTHTFLTSSCGINSSDGTNTYENSFSANILASNPCSSSSVGVVPIYVSTAPEANFDSPEIACINTSVCLTNQSIGDTNTGSSSACNTTPNIIWSISPDTGFTISSGSLGNDFGLTDASSWFSGSDELCLSFSESGTYTITQNAGNTCGFDSISETICIDTPLTPIFNLDEISICGPDEVNAINNTDESLSCSDVTYLWEVDYTSDFCNSSTTGSWSFVSGVDENSKDASFNFITPGVYTVSLTVSNSCGEETTTQNVNVKQPPKVEINSIADVCNTFNISPSAIISECTDDSTSMAYAWSFVGATPATSNLENPGEIVYATPGTYTITLKVTNDCGVSETATETFTIKETPVITNTNLSQSICSGSYTDAIDLTSSVPGTSYSWTAVGTSGVTGFTTSGTTNTIPAQIISTTSSVSGTVTYSVTPTAELCLGDAVDFVITVNPAPQFVTQPLSSNVCQNGTATILEVSLSNNINTPNYQWYSNNSNSTSGGILISGATNSTYQPPTDVEGTLYYYCEITFPIEGCTSLVSNIAEVEVAPIPKISVEPIETESLCVGGNIDTPFEVVHTGGLGPVSYQWFSNTSNSSTGGTEISGATSSTYTPNIFNTVGTYFYYVELSFNISGCTNVTSSVTEVNVLDLPLVDVQAETSQTLCVSATPIDLEIEVSGGVSDFAYQWYSNGSNSTTGGTEISGATNAIYTPSTNTAGTIYYYCVVYQPASPSCSVVSAISEVIVNEAPAFVEQPSSQALCLGDTVSDLEMTYENGVGTATLQWYSNTANDTATGTEITGATNNIYSPDVSVTGTTYYYGVITFSEGGCTEIFSDIAEISVSETPGIITQAVATQTLCESITPQDLEVEISGTTGVFSYQWYSNGSNSTTGGTEISGATSETYTPETDVVGTTYYYVEIYNTLNSTCKVVSAISEVIVNEAPAFVGQPSSQALCLGDTVSDLEMTYTNGVGTTTLQWYSNTTNDTATGTEISGAINSIYSPDVSIIGTTYYYGIITFSEGGCTEIISDIAEISVSEVPVIDTQALATQTLCESITATTLELTVSGGVDVFSYQWYSNGSNSTTGGTEITGATSETYTPETDAVGTTYYYVEIYNTLNDTCKVVSAISEVIVNEAPAFVEQPESEILCLGESASVLEMSYINGVGVPGLQWYSNTVNSSIGGTIITGAIDSTYSPDVSIVGTTYYYGVITFSEGGCSEIVSDVVEIIVNDTPSIDDLVIVVCSEKVFTVNPDATNGSSVPANTTYTWNMPTVSPLGSITGISEENNPQTEISQVLTNNTTSPAVVTYVVTPVSGLCIGENFTIEVTVNPSISTEIIVVNSFCFESNSGSISAVISGGVPFSTGNPYIINWMGPNGFVADTATISNLEPGDYVLTIDDEGGCPLSETYTITEPEILSMVVDTETSISCFEAADGEITISVSGGTLNYTYNWTKDGIPFSTDEDIYNLEPGNYEITISDANNCGPVNQAFLITEPDELEVSLASKDDVLCYGFSTGSINITTIGGTPTEVSPGVFDYNYQWTGPNGFLSSTSDLIGLIAGTYQLTVTDANNCSDTLNVTLTQPDEIVINYTFTEITCYGAEDASINITSITGGAGIFDIAWNNFAEGLVQNNLSAGDYIVTVTDADNCEMSTTITIPEAPIFAISPDIEHVSCFGANDGRITLNFQGGQDPIDVIWDDDSTAGVERNNLAPGTYNLTISDGTPCYIYETFTILEPDILAITANISNAFDCDDPNSGAINLIITGGTTPYTVNWSNGSTTEDLNNIPPGTYFVEVVDANGCEISDSYTIVRPSPIVVDVITETEADCDNVNVTQTFVANVSGGVPPYQLNWSNGTVSGVNNEFMNTTQNGLVILEATDDLGCVSSFTFEVDIPELSAADFETTSIAYQTYGLYSMADPIEFFNTTSGDYESVFWDFGDGNFSSEENPTHIYTSEGPYVVTQTVTFPFGCVYTKVVTLIIEKGYKLIMPNAFSPNQDGINDYFTPVYIGLDDMELNIYDTWGSLIYTEANDDIQGWDGTVNGESAENGNYYYTFTAKTFYGSKIKENGAFVSIK